MLEELFPISFKARTVALLVVIIAAYVFIPVFIGIVGSAATAVPYVSTVITLLTVVVSVYCAGGIVTALLYFFGRIS